MYIFNYVNIALYILIEGALLGKFFGTFDWSAFRVREQDENRLEVRL